MILVSVKFGIAQNIPPASVEDKVIGCIKIYNFQDSKEPLKVDDKLYSAAQLSIGASFGNWIQASYTPKGGLGDIRKSVSEKLGLYNRHTAGKPQSYGAYSRTFMQLKYDGSGKIVPLTGDHIRWGISANGVPGDWGIKDICTPTQYYFTLSTAETEIDDEKEKKLLDLTKQVNIKPYISFRVKNLGSGGGVHHVLFSKDNKFPFVKLTKGEYLQALETALPRYYEAEKKRIYEAEQGDQKRIAVWIKPLDEKLERFRTGLRKHREKYKDRLGEPALTSRQPALNNLDNGTDVFSNGYLTDPESTSGRLPVYKVDPVMAELTKKDKPQWILVSWDFWFTDSIEGQQHEAIINNFNFDYNFFFNPKKVKGQPYKPLRSPPANTQTAPNTGF